MNDPGKLMELAVVFLVCPHFVLSGSTRRRAAPKCRRYSAHCSPTGKGVVDDDARQLHAKSRRQFFEVQSPVIELDIAQWLIHCHGVGERSPSSSSTACSVDLQARSAESSHRSAWRPSVDEDLTYDCPL